MMYLSHMVIYAGVVYFVGPLTPVPPFFCLFLRSAKPSPSYNVRLYNLHLSLSCAESILGVSLYLRVIYVTEMFRDPCFVPGLSDLSAQSLLILPNCCFFFHGTVPPSPFRVSSSSPPIWPCFALVSPCPISGVRRASTSIMCWWLTDALQPLTVCHPVQRLSSSSPLSLWFLHQ